MKRLKCLSGFKRGIKRAMKRHDDSNPPDDSFDMAGLCILVVVIGVFFLCLNIFGG